MFALAARRVILLAAAVALALPSATRADPENLPGGTGAGAAIGAVASAFGLTPPVRIGFCEEHPEDGTLGVTIVDRSGREFPCGLEAGHPAGVAGPKQPPSWPRRVFVGATRLAQPTARLLPLWGTEERALIQLLTAAIADSISDAQNDLLLKGARSGVLTDPGGFGLIRLIGSVEQRRRMLAAISAGETAPAGDALSYFGLTGPLRIKKIELDRSDRLTSIAVLDALGREVVASPGSPGGRAVESAWYVDLGRLPNASRIYVPLGGYEERYLLTVLSAALHDPGARAAPSLGSAPADRAAPTGDALKAAVKTIEYREQRIRERDRFN